MTDEEYREFLTFLFERYVRPRLPRVRRRFHHHMMEEWCYHLDQVQQASHVLRYIEAYCDDNGDIYRTFTLERLTRAVSDTRYSLEFSDRTAEEAGFLDAFEAHADDILSGLQPQLCFGVQY
jgi:sulfatase maturation enzyme AslB (radical SAM superfamily)